MTKHVIYYFSGTGNSLRVSLGIQKALENCDVVSMGSNPLQPGSVSSAGFVFPCYFGGVPHRVMEYVKALDLAQNKPGYLYAVVTCGSFAAHSPSQLNELLASKGTPLDYSAVLRAFSNYVIKYDMSSKVAQITARMKADLQPIINDIREQKRIPTKKSSALALAYNRMGTRDVATEDRNFIVQETCDGCALCTKVCPVRNVCMQQGKPSWLGHCEQCLACLQWCPQRAIDFGQKTRKRGRYTNPEITSRMFIDYLQGAGISGKEDSTITRED